MFGVSIAAGGVPPEWFVDAYSTVIPVVASNAPAIVAYLPGNYRILGTVDGQTVIAGRDQAGWTLRAT